MSFKFKVGGGLLVLTFIICGIGGAYGTIYWLEGSISYLRSPHLSIKPSSPPLLFRSETGVKKDIWLTQEGNQPLHYMIRARESIFRVLPNNPYLIEELYGMEGWVDGLRGPGFESSSSLHRSIHFFEAHKALYYREGNQLEAREVHFKSFIINRGNREIYSLIPFLPLAYLTGSLKVLTLSLEGGLWVEIEHLRLSSKGGGRA